MIWGTVIVVQGVLMGLEKILSVMKYVMIQPDPMMMEYVVTERQDASGKI